MKRPCPRRRWRDQRAAVPWIWLRASTMRRRIPPPSGLVPQEEHIDRQCRHRSPGRCRSLTSRATSPTTMSERGIGNVGRPQRHTGLLREGPGSHRDGESTEQAETVRIVSEIELVQCTVSLGCRRVRGGARARLGQRGFGGLGASRRPGIVQALCTWLGSDMHSSAFGHSAEPAPAATVAGAVVDAGAAFRTELAAIDDARSPAARSSSGGADRGRHAEQRTGWSRMQERSPTGR